MGRKKKHPVLLVKRLSKSHVFAAHILLGKICQVKGEESQFGGRGWGNDFKRLVTLSCFPHLGVS